jgi:hypothetical protein
VPTTRDPATHSTTHPTSTTASARVHPIQATSTPLPTLKPPPAPTEPANRPTPAQVFMASLLVQAAFFTTASPIPLPTPEPNGGRRPEPTPAIIQEAEFLGVTAMSSRSNGTIDSGSAKGNKSDNKDEQAKQECRLRQQQQWERRMLASRRWKAG